MSEPSPFQRRRTLREQLRIQRVNDRDLDAILKQAASDAADMVMQLEGKEGVGSAVRRAQQQLSAQHIDLWREAIKGSTEVGIGDGVDASAADWSAYDEIFMANNGLTASYWHSSILETSRRGIESLIGRKEDGITLAQRVYRQGVVQSGEIGRIIDSGLLRGLSAKELAKNVFSFIDPNTPGGASYAASRLARSEINNAFHRTSINRAIESPWTFGMRWNLSSSHPEADDCDDLANATHIRDGEPGVFRPEDVPRKPHPQCFCYVTPVTMDDEEFLRRWKKGQFDKYIEDSMGCVRI